MDDSPIVGRSNEDEDADSAWTAELERRARELESGEVEGIRWEEVRKKLLEASEGSGCPPPEA